MHWFSYVWMVPIVIGVLIWAFASVIDIIEAIQDFIKSPRKGNIALHFTYYLEDYTKSFIAAILLFLFAFSLGSFIVDFEEVIK